ncbi:MAG: hypothetical protein MMC33_005061 [Icmadophila ericetorum]|nr:hypothetical protein [Icmadophila ericetorum]
MASQAREESEERPLRPNIYTIANFAQQAEDGAQMIPGAGSFDEEDAFMKAIRKRDLKEVLHLRKTLSFDSLDQLGFNGEPNICAAANIEDPAIIKAVLMLEGPNGDATPVPPGISCSAIDTQGRNALHIAAKFGHIAVVKELFKLCPTYRHKLFGLYDHHNDTPISLAIRRGYVEVVRLILDEIPDDHIIIRNGNSRNPESSILIDAITAHRPTIQTRLEMVHLIMQKPGTDPNKEYGAPDDEKHTAVQVAAELGNPEIIQALKAEVPKASELLH